MTIYTRPENTTIWAENGNISLPTTDKQEQGWVTEKPPSEMMNWIHNKQDKGIAYLLQEGISAWHAETEYTIGAFVKENGVLYQAKLQNLNKLPSDNPSSWDIAFDSKGSALAVQNDLNLIKDNDGQLPYYVRKASPVMTAKATGTSFAAQIGLGSTDSSDVGHSFVDDGDSGLFKSGDVVSILNDSLLIANFPKTISPTDSSKSIATTEWVTAFFNNALNNFNAALEALRIPVGNSLISNNSANPSTYLNYGTWIQDVEGKALVGVSSSISSSVPSWAKAVGQTYGEYDVILTAQNVQDHQHNLVSQVASGTAGTYLLKTKAGTDEGYDLAGTEAAPTIFQTPAIGTSTPHNNVQPSQTKYIWTRTA